MDKTAQTGMTLLEALLVIAVAAFLLVMGMRVYKSFEMEKEAQQLKLNVNILFQALSSFYRANCILYRKQSGGVLKAGELDPIINRGPNFAITDISAQLQTPGYLTKWPFIRNTYVNNQGVGNGYVVQFNLATVTSRQQLMNVDISPAKQQSIGSIYVWKAQVAVQVSNSSNANMYQNLLGADCLSSYDVGNKIVKPCSANSTGDYIVWERLPSFGSPETMTDVWPLMPTLNEFTQMYTTNPILTLTNGSVTNQAYLCGG